MSGVTLKYDDTSIEQKTTLDFFRFRPEMFLGNLNLDANIQILREYITNAFDESLDVNRKYEVKILLFKGPNTYQFAIIDHGRGIPCGKLKAVYSDAWTSGKYDTTKGGYRFAAGAFGCGTKVSNANSTRFIGITKRLDGFAGLTIEKGNVQDYQVTNPIDNDPYTVGTTAFHQPDETILEMTHTFWTDPLGYERFLDMLDYMTAFMSNTIVTVMVIDKLLPDKFFKQDYYHIWKYFQDAKGTVVFRTPEDTSPLKYVMKKFDIKSEPVWRQEFHHAVDLTNPESIMGFDIEICCGPKRQLQSGIVGTVNTNFISRYDSSHIKCLLEEIKSRMIKYLPDGDDEIRLYYLNKYNLPVYGYVSALWKDASYAAQTKDAFFNNQFEALYRSELKHKCDLIPDEQWELFFATIEEDLMDSFNRSNNRSLKLGSNMRNISASLNNDCYIPCRLKDPSVTELFITEGDSAGDWVAQARDPAFQAVMKLRGKPLNAFDADMATIKANTVLQDMFRILGVSPRDTNLDNMNFKSIGILADADPDGYHIVALTIGNLYKINPLILQQGRVFIANPPLFSMERKDSALYVRDAKALNDARVKIYSNYIDLELEIYTKQNLEEAKRTKQFPKSNVPKVRLTHDTYRDFVYAVNRVCSVIIETANRLVIEPILLEQLIHCVDYLTISNMNIKAIGELLNVRCEYNELANTLLLIDGGNEIIVPLNRLTHEVRSYILPLLNELHWENFNVYVTTKCSDTYKSVPMTFMQIYQIFRELDKAFPIHRMKGLGECSVQLLRNTCCDPKTRSCSTITSLGDVDEFYKMLGSDPTVRKQLVVKDLRDMGVPSDVVDKYERI